MSAYARRVPVRRWPVGLLLLAFCAWPIGAYAADTDEGVSQGIQDVLNEEYAQANYAEAKRKLLSLLDRCAKKVRCSPATKASVSVALGMVASQVGAVEDAKGFFRTALGEDAHAKLPSFGTSPAMRAQLAEAQKEFALPNVVGPVAEEVEAPGGKSEEWVVLAQEGLAADKAGRFEECIERDQRSIKLESHQPVTYLHLSSCQAKAGKLIDALKNLREARRLGLGRKDDILLQRIAERQKEFLARMPHVVFVAPKGISDFRVTFDDRPVPVEKLAQQFPVDPGKHTVRAQGTANNVPLTYEEEFVFNERDLVTVKITLSSQAAEFLTPGQLKCVLGAKNQEDILKCLPENGKNLVGKISLLHSSYADTNHVYVQSPELNASVSSPTAGWNVGGSFLVDFVSAASPDIVSEASPPFKERRYAGSLTGGYKPGAFGLQGMGNVSSEPDYVSFSGGLAATADLYDKLITPRIAYSHSDDTITRQSSPRDAWQRRFFVNQFDAGLTIVLSANSLIQVGGTLITERGDPSKPYRFVPMFEKRVADAMPSGATVDLVNKYRLPFRPVEQLPTERDRYALAVRWMLRVKTATLRLEERVYYDTWGIKSTTTDGRYMMDVGRRIRAWPHLRLYGQTGADFQRLAYFPVVDNAQILLPTYRTGDRELSPMITVTLGGGARLALTRPEAPMQLALLASGDMMYSSYFASLFIRSRAAVYGTLGVEAEFQ